VLPRSGRVDGGVDHARAALALGEPRAAPVRSGWAEATQRGRGNGGKVVRKRGRGMKICRVKYYVDFGGFFIEKRAYAPLRWNHLEHEDYRVCRTKKNQKIISKLPFRSIHPKTISPTA
jgi:hypothetical protein